MFIRKSEDRGHANHGWLQSQHTFSFADYYDPRFMGFGSLRVINEDYIDAANGFGAHPHQNMEIITYVVAGSLTHKDSMGNEAVVKPGEVQRMSAGTGVVHSEKNGSETENVHLFQIWILPEKQGINPSYGQKDFSKALAENKLTLVVSKDGRDGSISMNQDGDMFVARLKSKEDLSFAVKPGRDVWVQVVKGELETPAGVIRKGDALAVDDTTTVNLKSHSETELIIFDLKK